MYRSWGGTVAIDEIETGLKELRSQGFMMGQRIVEGVCAMSACLFVVKKVAMLSKLEEI